jgi:hypothetical protein
LSYLSAAWCGISLLAIGAFITAVLGEVLLKLLKTVFVSSEYQRVFVWIFFVAGVLGSLIVLPLGLAFGRYLLRTLPFAMSDRGRGQSGAVALYVVYISLYFLFLGVGETLLSFNTTTVSYEEEEEIAIQLDLLLAMFWATGVIGLLIRRHRRLRSILDRPFVVFLRRFSTFPDRAVIALILKQAAYNVPVVFLTPTHSRPGDWDPYLVGFAGLKLLHPWRSAPIVIRVPHDAWQEAADELIRRAQTILLDTSETSSALRTEAEMLDRAGRWPDTVCLRLLVPSASTDTARVGALGGVRTIEYTKSWVRALPKMLIGLPIVLCAAIFFFISSASLFASLYWSVVFGVFHWVATVAVAPAAVAYYCSVFVLPTINRDAKLALRKVLRAGHAAATNRNAPQGVGGWLIFPVIGLMMVLILLSYTLLTRYWPIFRDGAWKELTTPRSATYHHLWGPLITFEIIGTLIIVALAMATLVLIFRKSKMTPALAIAFACTCAALPVLDHFFAELIPAVAQQSDPADARELIGAVVGAVIWISYFLVSRRVKATFK